MILLAVLTFGLVSFAQSTFTQATFKQMLDEYKKDSKAFFIDRLSEDFRYSNPQGKFLEKKDIITNEGVKIVTTDVLQPVIFQSGDLGMVSGIHKTSAVRNDGSEIKWEVVFTYTFQRRNGKWMFVASQQTNLAE